MEEERAIMPQELVRLNRGGNKNVFLKRDTDTGKETVLVVYKNSTLGDNTEEAVIGMLFWRRHCFNIITFIGCLERDRPPKESVAMRKSAPPCPCRCTTFEWEYANEGNVDTYITKMYEEGRLLPHDVGKAMVFQEAVGIAVVHLTKGVVHLDIKESNILLHRYEPSVNPLTIGYRIFGARFLLEMEDPHKLVPKLGGFGTSQRLMFLPKHRRTARIIAPELASPEALILGKAAELSDKQDVLCYGYNMIHVMSGFAAPFIIMWNLRCPLSLMEQLRRHWEDDEVYSIVKESIADLATRDDFDGSDDGSHDDDNEDESGDVIFRPVKRSEIPYHTLYRVLVLTAQVEKDSNETYRFALPSLDSGSAMAQTPAWQSIDAWLDPDGPNYEHNYDQFQQDCIQFNLRKGGNTHIERAREGLGEQGVDLVLSLLRLDPDKRPAMKEVILSDYMDEFRVSDTNSAAATMNFHL